MLHTHSTLHLAVQMLREHNILSVPVIGADGRSFSGCFSITDVLKMLVRSLRLENRRQSFDMRGNDAARALQVRRPPFAANPHTACRNCAALGSL